MGSVERRLHVARFQFGRVDNDLFAGLLELLDVGADDVLILHQQNARFGPFALRREADIADDGLERLLVNVFGELAVIEAAHRFDRLLEDLHFRVGEGRNVDAERVDAGGLGPVAIETQQLLNSGEVHRRFGHVQVVTDDIVQHRVQLRLERCELQSDGPAAKKLGGNPHVVGGTH